MKREELKNGYYWVMPQRGYYKDKWVIATYENGMFWIHGTGEAFMPDSLTINYNKIPMTDPLPPAEGAEAILHRHIDKQSMDELSVNVWPDMLEAMHEFAAQPQPTAEGAEEIAQRCPVCGGNGLVPNGFYLQTSGSWLTASITPETCRSCNGTGVVFATLHAQRLAEKMVEERLVEFGNMIRDEPNGDIPALADYFMRTINLKSRER